MPDYPAWVLRYLAYLQLAVGSPSLAYLSQITAAHLRSIPFESISKLCLYRRQVENGWLIPPPDVYVANLHELGTGGTCFTNNGNLHQLLLALGFDATLVPFRNANHVGIVVRLPEGRFYADVGSAGPLFAPVPLDGGEVWREACGQGMRFAPKPDQPGVWGMEHWLHGACTLQWEFAPDEATTLGALTATIAKQNEPGSLFLSMLRCHLWQPERQRVLSLVSCRLAIRYDQGGEVKVRLSTVEEIKQVLRYEFGLPRLPVDEALDVLASLGVDIFAPAS